MSAQRKKHRRKVALQYGSAGPVSVTHEEVEALAKGEPLAKTVVKRLRAAVPSGPLGKLKSAAAAPVPISRSEMAKIRKSGKITKKLRDRLETSSTEAAKPRLRSRRRSEKKKPYRRPEA